MLVFDSDKEPYLRPLPSADDHNPRNGHIRQLSTHSRSSAINYRHFSMQPPAPSTVCEKLEVGVEPGIDYGTTLVYLQDAIGSEITCTDYNVHRIKISQLEVSVTNGMSDSNVLDMLNSRPDWSKVRWINVNGLSSEAIGPISRYFQFHPLVVEDMVDIPQRTKVDVFNDYMFACFPLHTLRGGEVRSKTTKIKSFFKTWWQSRDQTEDRVPSHQIPSASTTEPSSPVALNYNYMYHSTSDLSEKIKKLPGRILHQWDHPHDNSTQQKYLPSQYKKKLVGVEQVSMFLTRDTIITFFEQTAPSVMEPLMNRMLSGQTILRQTEDPGILAQAIIDTCVDLIAPIIAEYSERIRRLQIEAIQCPTLVHTRALNILLSDLTVLLSSVSSMSGMINSFKSRMRKDCTQGFQLSETATLYFGDVADHIMSYVSDLSIMHEQTKQITTLIFNTISIKSSDAVRLLSLVTVVFLPLSSLTGYFGMNFADFDILNNSVDYYWCIAGPFTAALAVLLTYPWVLEKLKGTYNRAQNLHAD